MIFFLGSHLSPVDLCFSSFHNFQFCFLANPFIFSFIMLYSLLILSKYFVTLYQPSLLKLLVDCLALPLNKNHIKSFSCFSSMRHLLHLLFIFPLEVAKKVYHNLQILNSNLNHLLLLPTLIYACTCI